MVFVWWLERKDGVGVFTSGDIDKARKILYTKAAFCDYTYHKHDPHNMPNTYNDKGIASKFLRGTHFCGFKSIKQYHIAVSSLKVRKELNKTHTKLVLYEVAKKYIVFGESQVVFDRDKAKKIKVVNPTYRPKKSLTSSWNVILSDYEIWRLSWLNLAEPLMLKNFVIW